MVGKSRIFDFLALLFYSSFQVSGTHGRLMAVVHAKLSVEVLCVGLDRNEGDEQPGRNLPVGEFGVE